eukprot:scaffold190532_cov33-Attheya_sp.AAC.2
MRIAVIDVHPECFAASAPLEGWVRLDTSCTNVQSIRVVVNAGHFCRYLHGVRREIAVAASAKISHAARGTILPSQVRYVQTSGRRGRAITFVVVGGCPAIHRDSASPGLRPSQPSELSWRRPAVSTRGGIGANIAGSSAMLHRAGSNVKTAGSKVVGAL